MANLRTISTVLEAPSLARRLGNGGKGYWRPVYNTVVKERPPKASPKVPSRSLGKKETEEG